MDAKKYGLQLRVKPQQKKQPTRLPLPTPLGFDDEDDDSVERDIMRQAHKNKTHKDIEEQHKKALEEDPSVFDYDGVYDKMKEKQVRPKELDRQDRKPRYIQALTEKAKKREREHEVIYERKLAKERSQDEHLYADKDKFVTSAYKKKLAEQAKWLEEERLHALREEKEDVTKKTDLTDFYFNLSKNVAFGAEEAGSQKTKKQPEPEQQVSQQPESPPRMRMPKTGLEETTDASKKEKAVSDNILKDEDPGKASGSNQPRVKDDQVRGNESVVATTDHHKRNEDAVAAAKARYLARKKAKVV